ncbi:acetate/propionate family kinase [Cellulomonas denverensis]|uniref:Acetate kinase n=1 Tax=Cellulomonas denverensis TaxID=264297 RepID=A0A7X6QZZ8_9CELL|nr:acetate kinase [Cellulomonas denverensis]NKY23647.1 acetate kinase [Cellulomonas denverensis]GIG26873.1 acetate kinase [Cellulomonas denverensis]
MNNVLVINSGSSSIKYQLVDVQSGDALASGIVERIGLEVGKLKHEGPDGKTELEQPIPDHEVGMRLVLDTFAQHGPAIDEAELAAVGHRIVQGGDVFDGPALVTDEVLAQIEELSPLAPLHNPANAAGVRAARAAFPDTPHVAVFDTAFHRTMPPAAYTYAIDRQIAADYKIRRYGAHGTSHLFVSREVAGWLGRDLASTNTIVLHLGNGASASAVQGGRCIDTSMGLTPLEGLVMGTRSGDIDPAVLFHLARQGGYTIDQLDELLNRKSGMLGLSGYTDMRDVHDAAAAGDENVRTALDVYYHRIKGYVGNYYAQLGRVDVIAFTAGIGENDDIVRAGALRGLEGLGIQLDLARNEGRKKEPTIISTDDSPVTVVVYPTNEELEIARQAVATI